MTRDEAIEQLRTAQPRIDTAGNAALWINAFVTLGMLKVEEPETPREKFIRIINGRVIGHSGGGYMQQYVVGQSDASIILQYIDAAGLKIVEK